MEKFPVDAPKLKVSKALRGVKGDRLLFRKDMSNAKDSKG
jgi:hypothetical protein